MKATVYKSTGSWYEVKTEDGQFYSCRLKGKFRLKGIKSTNPLAVGDQVFIDLEKRGDEEIGVIKKIEPRENYIIRKSVNLSKQTHIIAANIDVAFLLITLNNPPTLTAFIDRFLVTAEAYHIKTVLLFNKVDSYSEEEKDEIRYLMGMYREIGYTCIPISAKTGKNTEKVTQAMKGKTSLFSGHSGVGKSTLINAIAPELDLKTAALSGQHQLGQHTTTFAEMFDLWENTQLIDTPGIKGFGMVEIDNHELGDYFPEFFKRKHRCKFNNCLHVNEPKCAVKKALEEGKIQWSRYKSYRQILDGQEENYRIDIHRKS